jgi:hypothetical protein
MEQQAFQQCSAGDSYESLKTHDARSSSCLHPLTQALIHYPPYEECTHDSVTKRRQDAISKCVKNAKSIIVAHAPHCESGFAFKFYESFLLYALLLLSVSAHTSWLYSKK